MQLTAIILLVIFNLFNMFWVLWFVCVINKQAKINEALAHYVAADLKQTWQKSAEELVKAIRGKDPV